MSVNVPAEFLTRMQALLGEEYPAYADSLQHSSINALRANTLKILPDELPGMLSVALEPVPWCPAGYNIEAMPDGEAPSLSLGKHPYHAAGLYYLQDPSAMAVVEILDPQPGERILDLAAAPGGKSTHIVSKMKNQGMLVANEIITGRGWELAENLERWGAANTVILNETPTRLSDRFEGFFDRVLLDAPCSGEGMFRKSENARRDWSPELVAACAVRQSAILEHAAHLVRPGGVLVYSTCTFSIQENETVVMALLGKRADYELEYIEPQPGFSPALVGAAAGPGAPESQSGGMVRLWPHRVEGEGHFIARMRRTIQKDTGTKAQSPLSRRGISDPSASRSQRRAKPNMPPMDALSGYFEFCEQVGFPAFPVERLSLVGSYLYKTVEGTTLPSGLKVIHPGLWLGTHKTGSTNRSRFVPAHALALWLNKDHVSNTVTLDHHQASRYLQGYPLDLSGREGWTLVCVDRFSLGWGKRVSGVVKNYYPKGLRWRSA